MTAEKSQLGPSKPRKPRPRIESTFIDQDAAATQKGPVKMFNIRMDANLHKQLKDYAYQQDLSMKEIVEGLLRDFFDTRES